VIAKALALPDGAEPMDKSLQKQKQVDARTSLMDIDQEEKYVAHVAVPSQKEIEEYLVRRRKRQMLERYTEVS